jgi:IS30 family transposase
MQDQQVGRRPYRGRRPSAARIRFLELLESGMTTSQAAREVGCNVRTGRDWAKGIVKSNNRRYTVDGVLVWSSPGRVKLLREERVISARFLSVEERIEIADLRRQGLSARVIAQRLNRSPSTISRELRRNAHPGSGDYRPWAAQRRAARRRARPKPGKLAGNPRLREVIADGLRRRWSPEQISRRLQLQFPEQPEMHVTHETIYQALYVQGRGELRRELARCLRTGRAARRPQRRPDERRSRFQSPMLMISARPAEAEDRAVPGHWESQCFCQAAGASAGRGGSW